MSNVPGEHLIAIVEDDLGMRQGLSWLLAASRFRVEAFGSAEEFLQRGLGDEFDCVVLDVRLPGMNGLALRQLMRDRGYRAPTLVVSGHDDEASRDRLRRAGVTRWLHKPFDGQTFIDAVNDAIGGRS